MALPKQIKIGAVDWDIVFKKMKDMGQCHSELHQVWLSDKLTGTCLESTLVHEMLHAVCSAAGIADGETLTEEQFVTRIEYTLYSVLKENGYWPSSSPSS